MVLHATYPYTGRFVLRLTDAVVDRILHSIDHGGPLNIESLRDVACSLQLTELCQLLMDHDDSHVLVAPAASGFSPADVLELERRATHSPFPPVHRLVSYYILDPRAGLGLTQAEQLFHRLLQLSASDGVDRVYREPELRDPAWAVDPTDDEYAPDQGYVKGGTSGPDKYKGLNVNNAAIWGKYDGNQIGFVDLERGWNLNHEDLPAAAFPGFNTNVYTPSNPATGNHGTAVLGVVLGLDNDKGIVGIAPGAKLRRVVSRVKSATDEWDLVNAILAALAPGVMTPGDVLLLEVETVRGNPIQGYPVEIVDLWFDAIRLAVGNGIVVVEAAGNGASDLAGNDVVRNLDDLEADWPDAPAWRSLKRTSPKFLDSGAIMVSACTSEVENVPGVLQGVHRRLSYATFGSRIDCYAWGENVYSAGYGWIPPDADPSLPNTWYTDSFNGTSAASAIIAGAALLVQDMHLSTRGWRLAPAQVRALLSDKVSGVKILNDVGSTSIGVMPDLVALAGKLGAVPDVFIRDSVTDAGNVPSGKVTMSPDIIVRNNPVPNAAGTFGEAGPWVNAAPPIDAVRVDQPNYLYVRLRNRSLVDATGVTVKLYWSKTSPLMAPFHWNFIGQLTGILVPAGGTLTVAGPFTWTPATGQLPTSDPGCFIAVAHHPLDPRPPLLPASTSWGKFLTYVRRNNNVARRSFSTIEPSPTSAGYAAAPFVIRGAGDEAREFSFQVVQQLPEGVRLWWDVPSELAAMMRRAACVEADQEGEGDGRRRLLLPRRRRLDLPSLILDADAEYPCTLHVAVPRSARPPGDGEIVLRQLWREREVGRLTWTLGPGGDEPR